MSLNKLGLYLCHILLLYGLTCFVPATRAYPVDPSIEAQKRLLRGEVVVGLQEVGSTRYVTGRILIDETPEHIWPIMVNPYEYRGTICPRMKHIEVIADQATMSRIKVKLDCTMLFPNMYYVVDSKYEPDSRIEFWRTGGTIRDFKGFWLLDRSRDGKSTEVTYCLYIDPGFPVPQWIVREGVKVELPRTLHALSKRVYNIYHMIESPKTRTIATAHRHTSDSTAVIEHN